MVIIDTSTCHMLFISSSSIAYHGSHVGKIIEEIEWSLLVLGRMAHAPGTEDGHQSAFVIPNYLH